jgi:hypothetical protein
MRVQQKWSCSMRSLFSALWQGILSCFGMSDSQKLGRAQIENKDLAQSVKDYKNEIEIRNRPAGSDDDVIGRL